MVPEASDIVRDAPAIAADPLPGALQTGRNLHGRPVAVVVHAETWSLVLRPHPQRPAQDAAAHTATSWAFLDADGKGYRRAFIGLRFDGEDSVSGARWQAMVRRVLTITA
jgi:hypothetical protein